MKQAQIFHQYLWIINTLRTYHKQTFDDSIESWLFSTLTVHGMLADNAGICWR